MTSPDDLAARMDALRVQSRAAADTFAGEMERLTREVAHRDPSLRITLEARGGIESVLVDAEFFATATAVTASGAASAALGVAGISALPDFSAQAREVMAELARGVPASDAIRETVERRPTDSELYRFPELTVEVDHLGMFALGADAEWFDRATAHDFAEAVKTRVDDVRHRRAQLPDENIDEGDDSE